jgi:Nucleotide modification associated domain 3
MKIILSRKGFDSGYGGYASPIMPDGRLISLPIPLEDDVVYSDLLVDNDNSYFHLMNKLKSKIKSDKKSIELKDRPKCHLDPDLRENIFKNKRPNGWKPSFGQIDAAQTHLANQGVTIGDIFLFFGWFRKIEYRDGIPRFVPNEPNLHVIFGYLQIGKIINTMKDKIPEWLSEHPHVKSEWRRLEPTNTLYVAADYLNGSKIKGAGTLKFNEELVLTKRGCSRSKWNLGDIFKKANISYHSDTSWKDSYFQSAAKGQEFVVEDNAKISNWALQIIEKYVEHN